MTTLDEYLRQIFHRRRNIQAWLKSPNPALGYLTPDEYLTEGREKEVIAVLKKDFGNILERA